MSLAGFQRALVDLAAVPALCGRVRREGAAALTGYSLTEVEQRRIVSAAGQRGMRVNGMLYRSNRLSPLVSQLPYTFHLLGYGLRATADAFWAENPAPDRNAPREVRRFIQFVQRRVDEGAVAEPLVGEVLRWERATYELALLPPRATLAEVADAAARARAGAPLRPHPLVDVAEFTRDPAALLPALFARRIPPYDDVATGEYHLLVDFRGERRAFVPLPPRVAVAFLAVRDGAEVSPADGEILIEHGLVAAA